MNAQRHLISFILDKRLRYVLPYFTLVIMFIVVLYVNMIRTFVTLGTFILVLSLDDTLLH